MRDVGEQQSNRYKDRGIERGSRSRRERVSKDKKRKKKKIERERSKGQRERFEGMRLRDKCEQMKRKETAESRKYGG